MGKENWEFKILKGTDTEVQMKINQWKHLYILKIYNCVNYGESGYNSKIYLSRTSIKSIPLLEEKEA